MATIGLFKPTNTGWEGYITTLTLCTNAQIMPNRKKRGESSPDYFIKAGDSDLGAAWRAVLQVDGAKEYLRCVLDDSSFVAPVQAALFERKGGVDLVWKR